MTRTRVSVDLGPHIVERDEVARMVERAVGYQADHAGGRITRRLSWDMKTEGDARLLQERLSAGFPQLVVFLEVPR